MRVRRQVTRLLIDVDAQQAAEEVPVDALRVAEETVLVPFVAQRDIKVGVGTEVEISPVVVARLVALRDERQFGGRQSLVRIRGRAFEARHTLVPASGYSVRGRRIKKIKVPVRGVAGMKRDAEQSLLATDPHL